MLRAARYLDAPEEVEFGEDFVATVRHGEAPDLAGVRARMEAVPELLGRGPETILYAVMDWIVDDYAPVVAGLENDIDEIEAEVFSGNPNVSRRIYELSREVIGFQRAVKPLNGILGGLTAGVDKYGKDEELRRYLRDVQDHVAQVTERVEGFRQLLQNILSVTLTLVGLQQNEEVKRISAWAAILFAPTLIGAITG